MDDQFIEIIGLVLLLIFTGVFVHQGTLIHYGLKGYSRRNVKRDIATMRRRIEELLKSK